MTTVMERAIAHTRVVPLATSRWGTRFVRWGESWQHGTAAYWLEATRRAERPASADRHQLTESLFDEVALCMLGGFGMPYELGLAAFTTLRDQLLRDDPTPSESAIEKVLVQPLRVGDSLRRYRFPHQRAQRLSKALAHLRTTAVPADPLGIRDWLTTAPGIGLKTASWIVRNRWPEAPVAVLDVHVLRAGVRATVFPDDARVASSYHRLEELFVAWAGAEDILPSDLDATIWAEEAYRARYGF